MTSISDDELRKRADFIARECAGIQPAHEVFYIQSILYAADRAYTSFARFDAAVAEDAPDAVAFAHVQDALAHAGALSRFFWPAKRGGALARARGQKLRETFDLTDASPLKDRRLRNAFEHFDENLDRFLLGNESGFFFPDPRVGDHTAADDPTGKIFKLVDPRSSTCVLLNDKFVHAPIRVDIERILGLAGGVEGGRLPHPGKSSAVNPAEAYNNFHAKWAPRLSLKERHIAEAFERGRDPAWEHVNPDTVPHQQGQIRILITLDSANLLGSIEPIHIDEMVEEWRHQLAHRKDDHRVFTRHLISQYMALNRHRGDDGEMMLCAAIWLIVTKDDTQEVVAAMRRGDIEIRYQITLLDDEQKTRFRLTIRDL